ncbi:hypothetical protein G9A89_010137 [Geosiphon pyriformis]|nr:hypothetical protein G9A89_010137 [Geosiphon pyriformis]
MAYAPIAKLEKFTGEKDDAQAWINDIAKAITTNNWNDARTMQILNQFIKGLHNSILQRVCLMHPVNLPTAITHARDFEATELEANHTQAVNLVMNGSSDLDSKLKQFSDNINQKLEGYLADNHTMKLLSKSQSPVSDSESPIQSKAISKCLPAYDAVTNLSANNISTTNLSAAATNNLLTTATSYLLATASSNLSTPTSSNTTPKLSYDNIRKPEIQNHPKLEISNGHQVDQAVSTRIITANGATKTPIGKIDDFPIKVNGIITPIKVLVMEATQYQALEKQEREPTSGTTIDAWTDDKDHHELTPILSWDDNPKGKQREELT